MSGELTAPVKSGDILAGRYRVERVLAAGGMGVVVAAKHVQLGQKVAVKFLLDAVATTSDAARRFDREAKAAALLRSEHIARVIDVGTLDTGAPYLVMEFLEGTDLQQMVETRGYLPPAEAIEYVLQALEGLGEAHVAGIIHRDLKPGNLFCTTRPDGSPVIKVLDFGISKVEDVTSHAMTSTTTVLGSPLYMSPEQMESAKLADQRSDIWSMGVVLQQLLTGHVPFNYDNLAGLCVAISTKEPTRLRETAPDLPAELEEIVLRCLRKNPNERYQNVAELAAALVPFAPEAAPHAARLRRLFGQPDTSGSFTSLPSISKPRISVGGVGTLDALGHTETALSESLNETKKKRRSRWAPIAVVGVVAIAGVSAAWRFWPRTPEMAKPAASSLVTLEPMAPPDNTSIAVSSLPIASTGPATTASASTTKPTGIKPTARPSATIIPSTSTAVPQPPPPTATANATSTTETQSTRK